MLCGRCGSQCSDIPHLPRRIIAIVVALLWVSHSSRRVKVKTLFSVPRNLLVDSQSVHFKGFDNHRRARHLSDSLGYRKISGERHHGGHTEKTQSSNAKEVNKIFALPRVFVRENEGEGRHKRLTQDHHLTKKNLLRLIPGATSLGDCTILNTLLTFNLLLDNQSRNTK